MNTKVLLAALASAALLTACDKNKENEVIPVSFSSFGFYAKDNAEVLKTDYIEENITSDNLTFTLPYGTDPEALKSLVAEFTATEGASVNKADESGAPDGQEVVSGETAMDFSSDVRLVVFLKNNYKAYTVSVKIAEPAKWAKVAETSVSVKGDPAFTINEKDGVPYIVGSVERTITEGDKQTTRKEPHLFKLDGTELKDVAGALAEVDSKYFALDFAPEGTPFVSFYDGSLKKQSVMKVGSSASYVGEAGSLFQTGGSSNSSVAVFPVAENDIWCAQYNNAKNSLVGKRALNLAHFDGTSWTNGIAVEGRNASDYAYCVLGKKIQDAHYLMVFNQNTSTISIYKYSEGTWASVLESQEIMKADGTTKATLNLRALDFDLSSDGQIYVMTGADYSAEKVYNIGVVRINPETKSQVLIGGETDINIDDCRSASFSLDSNDVPYIAYTKLEGDARFACIRHIDGKTKTWSEDTKLSSLSCGLTIIRFSGDGKGYVANIEAIGDSSKYVLYSTVE